MNATKFFAAVTVFAVAGSAFAADATIASTAVSTMASTAHTSIAAVSLNVPVITISNNRDRSEVRAEAVQEVKTYRTTLAKQLDLAKN
jgi:hypothetical protein